ncbi:UNVERIFIED_CONTAM: hypothetical protein GTU68_046716 [Idotea baltica]|nr:hypothetical protein [Idotea baltica]
MADSLSNYQTVKLFARKRHEQDLFNSVSQKRFKAKKFTWRLWEHFTIFQGFFMLVITVLVLYLCGKAWSENTMSIGNVVLIQTLVMNLLWRIWDVGRYVKDTLEGFSNCEEMIETIQTTPEIVDPKKPEKSQISKGSIILNDVSFTYEENKQVFHDFSLHIKAGEKIGLVGESGSGKSTLSKLLMRFHDIEKGEILIDGQNITNITQDDLRRNIAFVPQDPALFHRSLTENIRYAQPDATEKEVLKAAQKAHAHEFILETKDGYETLVGERGVKLSGGERQRVAIARAMLKKAPVLILDEATSALDSKVEKYIQEALLELMKNRTTIVIAHRLSTLRHMDRIIVLDKGKIAEEGTHEALLKKKGKYSELWDHQVGGFVG